MQMSVSSKYFITLTPERPAALGAGGLFSLDVEPRFELLDRIEQAFPGTSSGQEHDSFSDAFYQYRIPRKAILLREAHGLAAAGGEELGDIHGENWKRVGSYQ